MFYPIEIFVAVEVFFVGVEGTFSFTHCTVNPFKVILIFASVKVSIAFFAKRPFLL